MKRFTYSTHNAQMKPKAKRGPRGPRKPKPAAKKGAKR